jgi:predicted DsbA family dithiol-disulfide isomerase
MDQVLRAKYGMSPEQIRAGHDRLTAMGLEVGFEFHFERIQLGSTFDAHRLAAWVRGTPPEGTLVKGLFNAYFTEGRLLSDHEVLLDVAAGAGIDADATRAVLEGDAGTEQVRADERAAHELGITGVPHCVINGAFAIPGAQDVETLVAVLRRAWERTERAPA